MHPGLLYLHNEVMVPRTLFPLLQCPTCHSRQLYVLDAGVCCASCNTIYPVHAGYIDLMPRGTAFGYTSKYVSEEEALAEELDYRELAPPLLAAGLRNHALVRLLQFQPGDVVLDNGCGTAKFAAWNAHRVGLMVGSDPATLFADAAVDQVALAKSDSRVLPFADNSFDKAFSIDVLEHFPRDVIDAYLQETARVLRPGGRFLAFSNTREPSSLQPLINLSRALGRLFVRMGLYDFQREARRKSDHIKALATWEEVVDAMTRAGLRPVRVVFWNTVFTTFVEHVLMKLGEVAFGSTPADRKPPISDHTLPAPSAEPGTSGTQREIQARRYMRRYLDRRGLVYRALRAITRLMELELWLFGRLRSGNYFIVVEKPSRNRVV